jgi:hypothetical protein
MLLHTGFKSVYGFARTNGTETDSIVTYLTKEDYVLKNSDALNEFGRLISRISEYQDSVNVNGESVTLQIENIVNYGEDFTETETFRIDKVIFDGMIKN